MLFANCGTISYFGLLFVVDVERRLSVNRNKLFGLELNESELKLSTWTI